MRSEVPECMRKATEIIWIIVAGKALLNDILQGNLELPIIVIPLQPREKLTLAQRKKQGKHLWLWHVYERFSFPKCSLTCFLSSYNRYAKQIPVHYKYLPTWDINGETNEGEPHGHSKSTSRTGSLTKNQSRTTVWGQGTSPYRQETRRRYEYGTAVRRQSRNGL